MADAIRELRLKVTYEAEQATSASRAFHDGEKKRIKETGDEQAKSDAAYVKAMKGRLAAEKQLGDEKQKVSRQEQQEQDKAEKDYLKSVQAKLRAEKQLDAEKQRAIRQQQREQDRSEKEYIKSVQVKLKAEKDLEDQQQQAAKQQLESIGKIGMAITGLAGGALATFAAHFDKIREDAFHAAEDVMKMRGAVRELQALRGELGSTGAGVAHVMKGASETLQTPEEYQQMELAGLGIGELAIVEDKDKDQVGKGGKVMTRSEFEKSMVAAGKMQAMEGGDAAGAGQLMSQIILQNKGKMTPEQAEGMYDKMFRIQQPGGFRSLSQAAGQYADMSGYIMNDVFSREKGMELLSGFSVKKPEEAGTMVDWYTQAMMAGRIRDRKMPVPKGIDMMKSGEYFKKLGITDQHDVVERGQMVEADLSRAEDAAKVKDKRFDPMEYLMLHGFTNQQHAQAIMTHWGLRKEGKLAKIEEAAASATDDGAISRRFEERRQVDPRLKDRQSEVLAQAATTVQGIEDEPLVQAQKAAFARLKARKQITGDFQEWRTAGWGERAKQDIFFGGYHSQVNTEAAKGIAAEQHRLGLPITLPQQATEDTMRRDATAIRERGGNLQGDLTELTRKVNDNLEKLVAHEDRKAGGAPRPMANAQPPRPANRN